MKKAFILLTFAMINLSVTVISCNGKENDKKNDDSQPEEVSTITLGGDYFDELNVSLEEVVSDLNQPLNIAFEPGNSERMYIVERGGLVRIYDGADLFEEPFLDISDKVATGFQEQGLLDMAFHPNFPEDNRVFVHFSSIDDDGAGKLVSYRVPTDNPNNIDPETETNILMVEQPYDNHNGGEVEFGDDGYLYIAFGDGGSGGDPDGYGQNRNSLLGTICRIDINSEDSTGYSIPPDNPFVGSSYEDEIWAWGLRNPWKFQFDPANGDLYIADVGQSNYEEINLQPAGSSGGVNYGWNIMEGNHCYPPGTECDSIGQVPLAEYDHTNGCSITGLGVYRGSEYPQFQGIYFSGDYCNGKIFALGKDDSDNWHFEQVAETGHHITGSGQDADGNIYVTIFSSPGKVFKIVGE
ncbi:MAG: PQQ-dependent sugar dehydrogenase [Candidatus Zixiibacteriota bacterium]